MLTLDHCPIDHCGHGWLWHDFSLLGGSVVQFVVARRSKAPSCNSSTQYVWRRITPPPHVREHRPQSPTIHLQYHISGMWFKSLYDIIKERQMCEDGLYYRYMLAHIQYTLQWETPHLTSICKFHKLIRYAIWPLIRTLTWMAVCINSRCI